VRYLAAKFFRHPERWPGYGPVKGEREQDCRDWGDYGGRSQGLGQGRGGSLGFGRLTAREFEAGAGAGPGGPELLAGELGAGGISRDREYVIDAGGKGV